MCLGTAKRKGLDFDRCGWIASSLHNQHPRPWFHSSSADFSAGMIPRNSDIESRFPEYWREPPLGVWSYKQRSTVRGRTTLRSLLGRAGSSSDTPRPICDRNSDAYRKFHWAASALYVPTVRFRRPFESLAQVLHTTGPPTANRNSPGW